MTPVKRKRHSPEEIIRKLRTAEEAVAGGRTVEEASLIMTVIRATCQRWKGRYSRREDRYNHRRPHSPLDDRTPAGFAAACLNPPGCSQAPITSDELRTHSRRPEPGNIPPTPGLAKRIPNPDPEAGKPDQPEPEESTHNEKLS
jgi:hypothetical protein